MILLDFSKAFDKVPHHRLLYKLKFYGIGHSTLSWIQDFLHNRSQKVVLNGCTSDTVPVSSGVPQGSVLGPLLFLLYINDLPDCVSSQSTTRLFADDCLLYRKIQSQDDAKKLQEDLDALQQWESDWLMTFNPQKCQTISVTNKRKPVNKTYSIHDQSLQKVSSAKYLGVHIQQNMNWNHHISMVTKKANSTRAFLQRNMSSCPRNVKVLCYKSLLRPVLEYGCEVWDPFTKDNTRKLEMVQRRYARFTSGDHCRTSSVTDMLRRLQWPTLEERRAQFKVLMVYRILNSLVDVPAAQYFNPVSTSLRGHQLKIHIPYARTCTYQKTFVPDAIRLWNSLPANTVTCTSVVSFKTEVQKTQLR